MKALTFLLSLLLIVWVPAVGVYGNPVDQPTEEIYPAQVEGYKILKGTERNIQDSISSALEVTKNPEMESVLENAQHVIDTLPNKKDSLANWLTWLSGLLLVLASVAGYAVRWYQERKQKSTSNGSGNIPPDSLRSHRSNY